MNDLPDLNDMRVFSEVAERGSFTAAADWLQMPKSRVSRRVAALESMLGVRLLQRSTRKLALTEIGQDYLRHCIAMREAAEAAQLAVAQVSDEPAGLIRLTCPVLLAQTVVGPMLPSFLKQWPKVQLEMEVTNRPVDLLEEGVDVALRVRSSLAESGQLIVKRLGLSHFYLVASPELLAREGEPSNPLDLMRMPVISQVANKGHTTLSLCNGDQTQELRLPVRYVVDDFQCLEQACLAGMGVCAIPDYLCHSHIAQGHLRVILSPWRPAPSIVHAVFPSRRGMVPAVRALLDHLGEIGMPEMMG